MSLTHEGVSPVPWQERRRAACLHSAKRRTRGDTICAEPVIARPGTGTSWRHAHERKCRELRTGCTFNCLDASRRTVQRPGSARRKTQGKPSIVAIRTHTHTDRTAVQRTRGRNRSVNDTSARDPRCPNIPDGGKRARSSAPKTRSDSPPSEATCPWWELSDSSRYKEVSIGEDQRDQGER